MDKKEIIHAVAIGSVLVLNLSATGYAVAAEACNNGSASSIVSNDSGFVKNTFTPKCSANVTVRYSESNTDFYVRGGSAKGSHTFGGSTIGGGVAVCESTSVAAPQSFSDPGTSSATNAGCA